jgi:hypothetical protein
MSAPPIEALIRQFLAWVDRERPTHAEVLDAWQSSCPRLSVWEDAMIGGLVAFDGTRERHVVLTEAGRVLVDVAQEAAAPVRV